MRLALYQITRPFIHTPSHNYTYLIPLKLMRIFFWIAEGLSFSRKTSPETVPPSLPPCPGSRITNGFETCHQLLGYQSVTFELSFGNHPELMYS